MCIIGMSESLGDIDMKKLRWLFLLIPLFFAGCAGQTEIDDIAGVWRTDNFEQASRSHMNSLEASLFGRINITTCGEFHIFISDPFTTAGTTTRVFSYTYEIVNGRLVVDCDTDNFNINMRGDEIRIRYTRHGVVDNFTFHKYSATVPYGWTETERREMAVLNQQINEEVIPAMADRFGEAIGLEVTPFDGRWMNGGRYLAQHHFPFTAGEYFFEISFAGTAPAPTRAVGQPSISSSLPFQIWCSVRTAGGQFHLHFEDIPDEWLEIFQNLDDSIKW